MPGASLCLRLGAMVNEPVELLEEVVLGDSFGTLEEAGEVSQVAFAPAPFFQVCQAGQVDAERGGKQTIASLPRELKSHPGSQKTFEVDVVPGRLPVSQVGQVFDG